MLKKILQAKKIEVEHKKTQTSLTNIRAMARDIEDCRPFKEAMNAQMSIGNAGIIAEIKKASPSKGLIRADFDPLVIAQNYLEGGAHCLSILTDEQFFQGHDKYIKMVKNTCPLPILRKDFILSPWQIYESRVLLADCVLLIVATLEKNQLADLYSLAIEIGMDVLIEVHSSEELDIALSLQQDAILGINNRNLTNFTTDLNTTYRLFPMIPKNRMVITESGISTREDVQFMLENNVRGFLIGESLMRAENPKLYLQELFYPSN